jgi:hypothetical protein
MPITVATIDQTQNEQTVLPDNVSNQKALVTKIGVIDKWSANRETSRIARRAFVTLECERIGAEERIGKEAIGIAEGQIRTVLVAQGMSALGAATTHLNSAVCAVDKSLTTAAQAEVVSHIWSRDSSRQNVNALKSKGSISQEEADVINEMSDADASRDIRKSRERMSLAKDAVDRLHAGVLKYVGQAGKKLQGD